MNKWWAACCLLAVCLALTACAGAPVVLTPAEETAASAAPTESAAAEPPSSSPEPVRTEAPSPSPTPEPLLKIEVEDARVGKLQERLIALGYLGEDKVTGYFGTETDAAVRRFQQAAGLTDDGIAGDETLAALYAEDAPVYTGPSLSGSLAGVRIGLDPGHQARGNSAQEPVAPGSGETKAKVSSGTQGVSSGVPEYQVNLSVGLKLRDLLESAGAEVIMTRESNDVDISNSERAQKMNDAGVDLVVRLHCDGEDDPSRNGAFILIPAGGYTTGIQSASRAAAEDVLAAFVETTGAKNLGLSERSDQTGFNWSTVPVINIEMGHMSNAAEDERLASDSYQQLCAEGIAAGLMRYFG